MYTNRIGDHFKALAAKILVDGEVNPKTSNQHEFNGRKALRELLGTEKRSFTGQFIRLDDDPDNILVSEASLTWYDARENKPHRSPEWRLYYTSNDVISSSVAGDLVVLGLTPDNRLKVLIAPAGSSSEQQLLWLFKLHPPSKDYETRDLFSESTELNYAGKKILEILGEDVFEEEPDLLGEMIGLFGEEFPTTKVFSKYARSKVSYISAIEAPDETLIKWLEKEESLFRTLEKHLVQEELEKGINDVDRFISLSLSVQNRRKARAGYAFENQLEAIFSENSLKYTRGARTERNNTPDFLFPGIIEYKSIVFPEDLLSMLGVKTSLKDRWRQIRSEADRISLKHLITLEPAISENQTREIKEQKIQLVLPEPIMSSYSVNQLADIISLQDFIRIIRRKEENRYA